MAAGEDSVEARDEFAVIMVAWHPRFSSASSVSMLNTMLVRTMNGSDEHAH